ncbi:MAG: DMT family transporter [Pseudomonadota bacterium]
MTAAALPILLSVFSAVTVAVANFTVKRGGDVLTARMVLSITMALTVLPFTPFVPLPSADLWPQLLGAVAAHWIYQFTMIRSLHRGDLSLVFPVMRGLAPLMTAILATVFLDESLSPIGIFGLILASSALMIFALPTDRPADQLRTDRIALGWAVATSFGIGLYSVVDAHVARQMPNPFTFIVWLFLLDWIGIAVVTLYTRRGEVISRVRPQMKAALFGGVAGTLSYGAAIIAFTLTDAVLVTALRETSVIFAALLAWWFLKEGFGLRRTIAAAILALGLVLLQLSP